MDNLDGTFSFPESVGNTTGLNSELTFGVLVRDIKDVRVDGVSVVGEDKVANILLADLIEDVTYDADNGTFRFIKKDGSHIEVDLPIENFIKGGYYNSETKSIVLILQNDDEVSIQIENLLDGYVAQSDIVDNLLSTDMDKPLSANQGKILRETIQGKELGRVFNNIQSMINSVNSQPRDKFRLAFMLYILDTQVPDFWVAGIEETSIPYTYTTDEAFLSAIRIAPVQVGYFKVSISETAKVDLENYVQKDGDKVLSDNNYTDADKAKVDIIETDGSEDEFLTKAGTYKEITQAAGGQQSKIYLTNADSNVSDSDGTAPQYKKLDYIFEPIEIDIQRTAQSSSSPKRIYKYLYDVGLGTNSIKEGAWGAELYCKVNNTEGVTKIVAKPFLYHLDGTETILFTAESEPIKNTTFKYIKTEYNHTQVTVLPTDRLGVELIMTTTRTNPVQLDLKIGDGYASFVTIPAELRHSQLRGLNEDPNFQHITQAEKDNIVKRTGNAIFNVGTISISGQILVRTTSGEIVTLPSRSATQSNPSSVVVFTGDVPYRQDLVYKGEGFVNSTARFNNGQMGSNFNPVEDWHYTRKGYVDTTIQTLIDTIVGED